MTTFAKLALLASVLGLSACNTATGVIKDTYGAGRFVVNQITDND